MSTPQNETLKRTLGMREAVTITVGTVVGVGLFTTGAQIVGSMGSAVILATFMAMVISVYPSHLYAEMSAALPFAGGTYKYAQLGLGKAAGMLAGWNFIASLVAVTSGEALAFSFYFKTLFRAFGVELPISDVLLAAIPIVLFIVTNIHGTEMTGRLQNGFMFFFWGVAIIWALMMIPNIRLPSYMVLPESMNGLSGWSFIGMVAMIWWCFAGFETCCALGEEIKHPRINLPRALKLSPFIVFAVNAIFQWFLVGIVPPEHLGELADASAPFADGMAMAGILGLPMAFLAAGIAFGGDFSTLNSSIAVPPRYLFAMAREGSMPKVSPFIVFAVNAIFQWFLVGIVPPEHLGELADASAPFADGMAMAGILGLPMAFLAAGIAFGGDFSTLNSSIAVPPRYLFAMAREGSMPKVFARLHPRYQTPWVSILFLGALSLVLVFYPITFVASVSLFADLFYYIIGIAAALGLRKRHPELGRPYKAPLIEVGVPVSILIYAIMLFQLDRYAIVSGIIWCVVGLVVYYICHAKYGDSNILNINDSITDEAPPSPEERAKMDKEYLLWKSIVAAFCIIAVLLYVIPLIF